MLALLCFEYAMMQYWLSARRECLCALIQVSTVWHTTWCERRTVSYHQSKVHWWSESIQVETVWLLCKKCTQHTTTYVTAVMLDACLIACICFNLMACSVCAIWWIVQHNVSCNVHAESHQLEYSSLLCLHSIQMYTESQRYTNSNFFMMIMTVNTT